MANTFKNKFLEATATLADLYTVPASTTTVVMGLVAANIDGASSAAIDVEIYDSSAATNYSIAKEITLPANSQIKIVSGDKLVLETGDKIQIKADAVSKATFTLSIMEMT